MFGLNKYVLIGLAASAVANVSLGYLYKEALQDTARVQLQEQLNHVIASQQSTRKAALAQAAAYEAREASLITRLARSDELMREHADRAAAAYEELSEFERSLGDRRLADPGYKDWADTSLPTGVADELRGLNGAP